MSPFAEGVEIECFIGFRGCLGSGLTLLFRFSIIIFMKEDKPYKVTLPVSIDRSLIIRRLIELGLLNDARNDILVDKMQYICSQIHRINIKMYASDAGFEDVHLSSKYMKANLGRSGKVTYLYVLDKLVQIGLIKRGANYRVNSFSKSHELLIENKLFDEHTTELQHWKPSNRKKARSLVTASDWGLLQARLVENIQKLQIDNRYALDVLNNQLTREKILHVGYSLKKLSSKNHEDHYVTCDKNGRVYHNLTGITKQLRPALSLDNNEPLWSIDLSASQMYFAIPCLKAYAKQKAKSADWAVVCGKYPDVQGYIDSVLQGRFYATILDHIEHAEIRSGNYKVEILKAIFTKQNLKRRSVYSKAIESMYPTFWAYLSSLKKNDYTDAANKLQQEESKVMIVGICMRLLREDCWFLPIHDCIVTTARSIDLVINVIKQEAIAATDYEPHYKVSQWSGEKLHWAQRETEEDWAEYGKRAVEAAAKQAKKRLIKRIRARVA